MLVKLVGVCVLKLHLLVFSDNWSLSGHEVIDLLSVFDSADHTLTLNNLLEFFKADLVNLVSLHGLLKESLHLVSLFNGFLVLWSTTLLVNEQLLVDLISCVFNDWLVFFFLACFFFGLFGSESVGAIGENNEDDEENEGENGFPDLDVLIKKHNPKPDVCPQGGGASNGKYTHVINLFNTNWQRFVSVFAISVAFRRYGIYRNTANNK